MVSFSMREVFRVSIFEMRAFVHVVTRGAISVSGVVGEVSMVASLLRADVDNEGVVGAGGAGKLACTRIVSVCCN